MAMSRTTARVLRSLHEAQGRLNKLFLAGVADAAEVMDLIDEAIKELKH